MYTDIQQIRQTSRWYYAFKREFSILSRILLYALYFDTSNDLHFVTLRRKYDIRNLISHFHQIQQSMRYNIDIRNFFSSPLLQIDIPLKYNNRNSSSFYDIWSNILNRKKEKEKERKILLIVRRNICKALTRKMLQKTRSTNLEIRRFKN